LHRRRNSHRFAVLRDGAAGDRDAAFAQDLDDLRRGLAEGEDDADDAGAGEGDGLELAKELVEKTARAALEQIGRLQAMDALEDSLAGIETPGDLAGIGAKYDPPTLQGRIVNPRPGGGRGQAAVSPRATRTVAVTLSNGQTISGALDFISEFVVTLIEPSGARRSFTREGEVPKVVVSDPLQAHFDMLRTLRDKDMQDLTAYLWTLK